MSDKIEHEDIIDGKGISDVIKGLTADITELIKKAKELSKAGIADARNGGGSESVRQTQNANRAINDLNRSTQQLSASEKELLRLQRSVAASTAREEHAHSDLAMQLARSRHEITQRNREIRQQIRVEDAAEDSLVSMRARLAQLNREYDNGSANMRAQTLPDIQRLRAELEQLESATGRDQMRVGRYREAWNETSQTFSKVKGVAMLVIGAVFAIGKAISKTTKVIIAYNKNLTKVSKTLKTTGDDTNYVTKEINALAAAFDVEFNDVLKASSVLVNEFGITGRQAVDIINEGFEKGANVNGEYLELLKEYPAQFKAAGLSAKQTIAFISQTESMGIFSDKGLDSIKEATIRLREMPKATSDALRAIGIDSNEMLNQLKTNQITYYDAIVQVSTEMSKLNANSVEVGTVIADVFGSAGEDAGIGFLTSIKDINIELDSIESGMSDLEIATNEFSKSWSRWSDDAIAEGSMLSNVLENIYSTMSAILDSRDAKNDKHAKSVALLVDEANKLKQLDDIVARSGKDRKEIIDKLIAKQNEQIVKAKDQIALSKEFLDTEKEGGLAAMNNALENGLIQKRRDQEQILKDSVADLAVSNKLLGIYKEQLNIIKDKAKARADELDMAIAKEKELLQLKDKEYALNLQSDAISFTDKHTEALKKNTAAKKENEKAELNIAKSFENSIPIVVESRTQMETYTEAIGFHLSNATNQIAQSGNSLASSLGALSSMLQERQAINAEVLASYDNDLSELENRYAEEQQKRDRGQANSAAMKREELDALNVERSNELKRQKSYTKTIQQLEELQQISSITTAIATLFKEGAKLPVIGTAAAILNITAMIGSYATFKAQALNLKDGMVDINGRGTTTSDSNPAMLSNRESIINAEGTIPNKGILNAINNHEISERNPQSIIDYVMKNHGIGLNSSIVQVDGSTKMLGELQKQTLLMKEQETSSTNSDYEIIKNGRFTKRVRK